jgi:uncharacterized protein with von Willebrand factor type A (vWA) domain
MRNTFFKSIDEILGSDFTKPRAVIHTTDRVFKSTRLEDVIYSEMRDGDADMDALDAAYSPKLPTFGALARDVFQSMYSLNARRRDDGELSDAARHINSRLLDEMTSDGRYGAIKSVCEGRQLPAYEAASEFVESISENLDKLLENSVGDKGLMSTLGKLENQETELRDKLEQLLQRRDGTNPPSDGAILSAANKAAGKAQQVKAVDALIGENLAKNDSALTTAIRAAVRAAEEKAEETALAIAAWGQDGSDSAEQMEQNREIIAKVRQNKTLMAVTRYLGRFREMLARARKNSYAYGRGEKYTLEFGNALSRVITSGFALLASPETIPLFLRKYQAKRLLQYKRRESIFKGAGDIIMCLDESGSTRDEAVWGKAVALTLLDAAMLGSRKFALIHFAGVGAVRTDVFRPGEYAPSDVLDAAATFLGGGTDFQTPLREALRLVETEGFENADIVFATDGYCALPDEFLEDLRRSRAERGFKVTGVLMDATSPGMEFSIAPFCEEVYRTSEFEKDDIVGEIISARV